MGGAAVAIIKIFDGIIQFALGRWGKKKDKKTEAECATENSINVLKSAMKVIMLDRILYLGRAYIKAEKVDADDRRRLCQMHEVYHKLGGNGDADLIMAAVNNLQLK
jgi:hypothetical protein